MSSDSVFPPLNIMDVRSVSARRAAAREAARTTVVVPPRGSSQTRTPSRKISSGSRASDRLQMRVLSPVSTLAQYNQPRSPLTSMRSVRTVSSRSARPQLGNAEAAQKMPEFVAVAVAESRNPGVPPFESQTEGYAQARMLQIRAGFIRKVYGIMVVQLLITLGIVLAFTLSAAVKTFVRTHPALLWCAIAVAVASLVSLACCRGIARKVPGNYICLFVFTLALSYLCGTIASYCDTVAVAWALGAAVLLLCALTILAWQPWVRFSTCSGSVLVLLATIVLFGIWVAAYPGKLLETGLAAVGVFFFGMLILVDSQRIIGGQHNDCGLREDDYIFAVLHLYIDFVLMFLFLLLLITQCLSCADGPGNLTGVGGGGGGQVVAGVMVLPTSNGTAILSSSYAVSPVTVPAAFDGREAQQSRRSPRSIRVQPTQE